jgi:AAA15 family ATPase/GTPase
MLIEFRAENHRSLRDEQVLTMQAGQGGDPGDARLRRVPGYAHPLLPVAAIYGANASGKSNVLEAFAFMVGAVTSSHRSWPPNGGVARSAFAWGAKRRKPSVFEASLVLEGTRYQYGFSASDERFLEEWLYAWPNNRKQTWFEREGDRYNFSTHLKGENKLIESVTRPNALFLSAASQHQHPLLAPVASWFDSIRPINVSRGGLSLPPSFFSHAFASVYSAHTQAMGKPQGETAVPMGGVMEKLKILLRESDVGISDFRLVQQEADSGPGPRKLAKIQFEHKNQAKDSWLPFEQESKGTQILFNMGVTVLASLEAGAVLLVDELESSLHPSIGRRIVGLFNDPQTNPRNAQLIFTTHDTNLLGTTLGEPVLRRDQVWLTEKDDEGATVLYPLTDFKPRKAENIERGYLQGRYGAVPFLGDFAATGK